MTSCSLSPPLNPIPQSVHLFPSFGFGIELNNNLHIQMECIVFLSHLFLDKGWNTKRDLNTNTFPLAPTLGFLVNSDKYIVMKCCSQLRGCFHHSSTKLRLYCQSLVCGKCQVFSFLFSVYFSDVFCSCCWQQNLTCWNLFWPVSLCIFIYIYIYINFLYTRPLWAYPTQLDKRGETFLC